MGVRRGFSSSLFDLFLYDRVRDWVNFDGFGVLIGSSGGNLVLWKRLEEI